MTDQTIPADKVREIATAMRDAMRREGDDHRGAEFLDEMLGYIAELAALLPAPPRPTLADMTEEERVACKWMQADMSGRDTRYVILGPYDVDDDVVLISAGGGLVYANPSSVTPRPDLPRMTWPGTEKPAPALPEGWRLADHPEHGRIVVTNPTPDGDGEVCFVALSVGFLGHGCHFCRPDELTYIDQEVDQ